MRVHELAKKLNISSKDICQFLSTADKAYKTMSGLTEEEEKKVRDHFKAGNSAPALKNDNSKNASNKAHNAAPGHSNQTPNNNEDGKSGESESKKKNHKISQLFFPQNSEKKKPFDKNRNNSRNHNNNNVSNSVSGQNHNNGNRNPNLDNKDSRDHKDYRDNHNSRKPANNDFSSNKPGFEKKNDGARNNSGDNRFSRDNNSNNNNRNNNRDNRDNRQSQGSQRFGQRQDNNMPIASAIPTKENRKVDNRKNDPKKKYEHRKDEEKGDNFNNRKNDKHNKKAAPVKAPIPQPKKEEEIKSIILPDYITIKQLAEIMKKTPAQLVKELFLKGKVVTLNTEVDFETAEEIAYEYDILCEREEKVDVIAELLKEDEEDESKMTDRPPVVAVMGHVDHGKTSLLDAIRETHVTDKESGGITQKIGAYQVKTNDGRPITFLDTPGHEAFTAMRMRGAQSTDIAILVVAADDGVMPQTVEAINHAKAAGVEIIVAVNKIDKPTANIEKVKQELTEYELISEEWGGSTIFCPVSAHTGEGIDNLLDMIMLTADVMELKANKKRKARGIVIEAELDKGRGVVATVLVQKGTLKIGDSVAAGKSFGKIRAMVNDKNKRVKEAGPSTPVEILGLNEVPNAGEILMAFDNDKEARNFASTFISEGKRDMVNESRQKVTLDGLFDRIKEGDIKDLNIIVKADVQGSVEAIKQSLIKLSNDEVAVKIIHGGVGNINESDVILASASKAIIIGFNVKPDNRAKETADREDVDMRLYTVIYDAIDDVEAALKGMLEPIYEERVIGHCEIRQIFKASGVGNIAGAVVMDGKMTAKAMVKITRDGKEVYSGKIASLRRFKDEVKEVKGGYECGLVFEDFDKIQEGDIVEASEMFEIPRQ